MKKHVYFLAALTGIAVLIASCHGKRLRGTGNKISSTRTITAFTELDLSADIKANITIKPGVQPTLVLHGYENILKHIKTANDSNTLRIYTDLEDSWSFDSHSGTTAELIVPSLSALGMSGSTDADIHGAVTGEKLSVEISGSGKLVIDSLNVTDFSTSVSGAANIAVNGGTAQRASYEVNGAGKIAAFQLQATEVTTSVSGAAKADVTALKTLNVNISGAGKIKYKGHPTVNKDISGAGTVRDVN
ncbi:hypothetical protein CJD36_001350 [Flavipsychrobacter stenotrophus]|uniref:Putative auto-transporter adhesin head GIN domain-containing protein n=1 Tax=Flavipsychrobacter stenotrophus TaxID=2077091 RepID=A0A2S7T0S8_9BACT|nr:head GIN domain-containing protein [Flavipsychrobacter stenotrophus]PQJ12425.1 hypothetical protein CJD36_001350 [Flavipsychrobacter stenotrophus]